MDGSHKFSLKLIGLISLSFLIFFLVLIFPPQSYAQGYYRCYDAGGVGACMDVEPHCASDYVTPAGACTLGETCNENHPCVAPTITPIPIGDCDCDASCNVISGTNTCASGTTATCDPQDPNLGYCLGGCSCSVPQGSLACNAQCTEDNQCDPDTGCGVCANVGTWLVHDFRCVTPTPASSSTDVLPYNPCEGVEDRGACETCVSGGGAYTALGCIDTDPGPFAAEIIKILFGLAGGVAFLLMIYGAFLCVTSRGDPQKAQACRETITAAVVGLLMLIFSLFIVRLIFGPIGIIPGLVDIF